VGGVGGWWWCKSVASEYSDWQCVSGVEWCVCVAVGWETPPPSRCRSSCASIFWADGHAPHGSFERGADWSDADAAISPALIGSVAGFRGELKEMKGGRQEWRICVQEMEEEARREEKRDGYVCIRTIILISGCLSPPSLRRPFIRCSHASSSLFFRITTIDWWPPPTSSRTHGRVPI
jgi:hypothetical protein